MICAVDVPPVDHAARDRRVVVVVLVRREARDRVVAAGEGPLPAGLVQELVGATTGDETVAWDEPATELVSDLGLELGEGLVDEPEAVSVLDEAETQRWKDIATPLVDAWAKEMDGKGKPGTDMVSYAVEMLKKNSGM